MKTYVTIMGLITTGLAVWMSHNQSPAQSEITHHSQKKTAHKMEQKSVLEIAIRKVKEGQDEAFADARTAFIDKLKAQEGIQKDWEFKSFFTMPEQDDTEVFVGMTRYESVEAMQRIADRLMQSPEAGSFFSTFDMKAFVAVQTADGSDFKLEDHWAEGNVLEVAVRSVKEGSEHAFEAKRKAFFDLIAQQEGYVFDQEFIDLTTGDKVVLIGWNSLSDFQKGAGYLQTQPEMGALFSILDIKAYQALALHSNQR